MDTNVLKNQLQTGKVDKPTILAAVKEIAAIDVSFEGEQADNNAMEEYAENCQDAVYSDKKCHQETQTEMFTLSGTEFVGHKPIKELLKDRL